MNLRLSVLLIVGLSLVGCKGGEILGGIVQNTGLSAGGSPVSSYAQSAVVSGTAVAKSMEEFTPEQEYYIGRTVAASLLTTYPPLRNAAANQYVNMIGQSLAMFSSMPLTYNGYHFQILDSMDINAFAAPGGFVLVTKGLIKCCPDENALAAVLAHEIAHVQNKDALRSIQKSRVTQAVAILGGETAKHLTGGQLGQLTTLFADSIGDIMTNMVNNGYSRSYELQADQGAVSILTKSGYNAGGLLAMLHAMDARLAPNGKDFAKTHPKPEDRIKELSTLVQDGVTFDPAARKARFQTALSML